ncbi:hypothetical protein K445DRAFT_320969, partial [Daldinia sp. EC12]
MSQDQHEEPCLATISFDQSKKALLYRQSRWLRVDNQLVDEMKNQTSSGKARSLHVDIVTLEAGNTDIDGHAHLKIRQTHFLWLLERANIPAASIGNLFHRAGRYFFSGKDFRDVPGEHPTSSYACMQIPSPASSPTHTRPFSLLLGISMQTNSAVCIVITGNIAEATTITESLQRGYDLISACPLHALTIFCEELSRLNEVHLEARHRSFGLIEDFMHDFCKKQHHAYTNNPDMVFTAFHGLNIVRRGLFNLEYDLELELEVLRFTQKTVREYQDMLYMPQCSRALWGITHKMITNLQDAARFRQKKLQGIEKLAGLDVEILQSLSCRNDAKLHLNIAENSRNDSISLRKIAVVTVVFLPITVVATISGSNTFDFAKEEIGRGVSAWKHWWVFLLVATILTFVVSGNFLCQGISQVLQALKRLKPVDTEQGKSENEEGRAVIRKSKLESGVGVL